MSNFFIFLIHNSLISERILTDTDEKHISGIWMGSLAQAGRHMVALGDVSLIPVRYFWDQEAVEAGLLPHFPS